MVKIKEQTILRIGNEAHKEFVDEMYPHFNLNNHPGYARVEVVPLIFSGGFNFNPDKVLLNDIQIDELGIFDTTFHESSHILHPYSKKLGYRVGFNQYKKILDGDILELIAHFGSIMFLQQKYGFDRVLQYRNKGLEKSDIDTALALYEKDSSLLGTLSNADFKNARRIIKEEIGKWF